MKAGWTNCNTFVLNYLKPISHAVKSSMGGQPPQVINNKTPPASQMRNVTLHLIGSKARKLDAVKKSDKHIRKSCLNVSKSKSTEHRPCQVQQLVSAKGKKKHDKNVALSNKESSSKCHGKKGKIRSKQIRVNNGTVTVSRVSSTVSKNKIKSPIKSFKRLWLEGDTCSEYKPHRYNTRLKKYIKENGCEQKVQKPAKCSKTSFSRNAQTGIQSSISGLSTISSWAEDEVQEVKHHIPTERKIAPKTTCTSVEPHSPQELLTMHNFAVTNPAPLQASTKVNATISQVHVGEMMKKESLGQTSSAEQFYLPNVTPTASVDRGNIQNHPLDQRKSP